MLTAELLFIRKTVIFLHNYDSGGNGFGKYSPSDFN